MTSTLNNWDKLAEKNPIHAAVAASDEAGEWKKSADAITILNERLAPGTVLDVGCGYGRIAKYLLPLRQFDRYIGVDGSAAMLDYFRQLVEGTLKDCETPVQLVQSPITDLPLPDDSVDNAIVSAVFLHNDKETTRRSLAEIYRVLKPGGRFFVFSAFPNVVNVHGIQGKLYLWFLSVTNRGAINGPVRYFTRREVAGLLGSFRHVEIRPMGWVTIPKRILLFPGWLNKKYQDGLYPAVHAGLSRLLSRRARERHCTYFDVYAEK